MSTMSQGSLQSADGTSLFYREWLCSNPLGAVQIVHGLGEHSGRYDGLAAIFNQLGLSVRAHDHRGHGRSDGARGTIAHSDDFLNDLRLVFDDFSCQQQTLPFLFGHSLGGLIAARFATGGVAAVRGLMLSSPALAFGMSRWQRALLALGSTLAPGLALPSGLPAERVSHDNAVRLRYRDDRLNHGKVSARVINFMLAAIARSQADAAHFATPLLLQVAGDDWLVDRSGSERFFAQVPAQDKTFYCYDGAYHEIFNESPHYRDRAQHDLVTWLARQLGA